MEQNTNQDPRTALGEQLTELGRKELCELISAICETVQEEVGADRYRGGLYPDNIRLDTEGRPVVGPASADGWEGQELAFLAPELFWHGKSSPASDVYSLGLLLYYALDSGRLPFAKDGEEQGLHRRLRGDRFAPPRAAGRRLGEIVAKATRFQAAERYQTVAELKAMLDNCVNNPYLSGAPSAETVFHKSDEDLSKVERMMVAILEGDEKQEPLPPPEPEEEPPTADAGELPDADQAPEPAGEEREAAPGEEAAGEPAEEAAPAPDTEAEPAGDGEEKPAAPPVVQLREEKNPELEPIVIKRTRQPVEPAKPKLKIAEPIEVEEEKPEKKPPVLLYHKSAEREKKIADEVRRRRLRPLGFVLALSLLLLAAAGLSKHMSDRERRANEPLTLPTPPVSELSPTPEQAQALPAEPVQEATPEPVQEKESVYQLYVADVSWTEARDLCAQQGGHLAVIRDEEEFNRVVAMIEANPGVTNWWLGCRRSEGVLSWLTDEAVSYYPWDEGEPSYQDGYDGTAEDYLLLWYHNGRWVYNDSRNDPVGDYPAAYSGRVGYVCEFDG